MHPYQFIPPRKRPAIPATRPLSVLDVIGAGYAYRCAHTGVPVEVKPRPVHLPEY
jgi:hypothetical protein